MRYTATSRGRRSRSVKSDGFSRPSSPVASCRSPYWINNQRRSTLTIGKRGRRGTTDEFSIESSSAADVLRFSPSRLHFYYHTLPRAVHRGRLFSPLHGRIRISHKLCGYTRLKRLGIYNFSCLFGKRSDRLFGSGRAIDRPAGRKGLQAFCFFFLLLFSRLHASIYYVHCIFFFCVTSLCASILFHRVIVQALSLVECRPIDQFLIDYILVRRSFRP